MREPRKVTGTSAGRGRHNEGVLIRDLFQTPERYLRSVHLQRDFHDVAALQHYVVTPAMVTAFARIVEGLRPNSGRRAWRITGDYGAGKSSFALVLAHLLRDPSASALARVRRAVDFHGLGVRAPSMVPVLVTGTREGVTPAVARAVAHTIGQLRGRGRGSRALIGLGGLATEVAQGGEAGALLELLGGLAAYVSGAGNSGVLLVLDELGKFLEYAALHPDREDVFVLQRLAEVAARSGEHPLILVGLLHQGFHAYAARLPSVARHEWEKVAGRFEEIVFDQPLAHTAALVAGALNVRVPRVPPAVAESARALSARAGETGWFRTAVTGQDSLQPITLYPLHATVLPVLVRFFARFGQHERSLFSFLLSSEPFGLQTFAERRAAPDAWYRLADFYDYVRSVFGHRLAGASYRSQWVRIVGIIDGVTGVSPLELRVLKTVAVLNVLDAEHLLATDAVLTAAVDDVARDTVAAAGTSLRMRGVLYDRGAAGGYCLWPNTSVNLEAAFLNASKALGPVDAVAPLLEPYLDSSPLVARRHYIETGTLRYFEVRFAPVAALRDAVTRPTEADGVVVVALCDSNVDQLAAAGFSTTAEALARPDVVIAIPRPLLGLAAEVQDARCWQWVADNTPELGHDAYAAAEVARQVAAARRTLSARLAAFIGFRGGDAATDVGWTRAGQPVELPPGRGLLSVLSQVCDELYPDAPLVRNELLNRRTLSSAAAAARMRLIERMFVAPEQPALGIHADKAPPEKSMYLSVLAAGGVHRQVDDRYAIVEPPTDDDPLRLRPALRRVTTLLEEADGQRVPVVALMATLRERPFGIRGGVIPLLLAIISTARAHELAVYENGTFIRRFGPAEFLRLVKLPTAFEFQLCRITGVRADVFERLVRVFAADSTVGRRPELLDVVTPLCVFAAQLPEYTRRSADLPAVAAGVRDALLSAREPSTLLFHDLPLACEVGAFSPDEHAEDQRVRRFIAVLRSAMDELRAAYPQLLERVVGRLARAIGEAPHHFERARLAARAARVALAAREPRLRAFALRLADAGLADDAWAEAVGSLVVTKPPARWALGDEGKAGDEIDVLAATFRRVEAIVFETGHEAPPSTSMRVGLTRGDGTEAACVVHGRPEDNAAIDDAVVRIAETLPDAAELRIAALSRLLWEALENADAVARVQCTPATSSDAVQAGVSPGAA